MRLSTLLLAGGGAAACAYALYCLRKRARRRVLVVGSINVDLYQHTKGAAVTFAGKSIDLSAIKGMTLPASSFVNYPKIAAQLRKHETGAAEGAEKAKGDVNKMQSVIDKLRAKQHAHGLSVSSALGRG